MEDSYYSSSAVLIRDVSTDENGIYIGYLESIRIKWNFILFHLKGVGCIFKLQTRRTYSSIEIEKILRFPESI